MKLSHTKRNTWLLVLLFLCLPVQAVLAQGQASDEERPQPQKLIVKVVDGYTGLPMWFEAPNVWLGSAEDQISRLNIKGEALFEVRETKPRTIRLLPNWYADCRFKGDVLKGSKTEYSIDEILEHGIVAENVCGGVHGKAEPGIIVLYVRHRTLQEILAL